MESQHAEQPLSTSPESQGEREERLKFLISGSTFEALANMSEGDFLIECIERENKIRSLTGDLSFQLKAEHISQEFLEQSETIAVKTTTQSDLNSLSQTVVNQDDVLKRTEETASRKQDKTVELDNQRAVHVDDFEDEDRTKLSMRTDLETITDLQANFDILKAKFGTEGALRTLLETELLKSSRMKDLVRRALDTAQALKAAVPAKSGIIEKLLNAAPLNLSAKNPTIMFAGFLGAMEKSPNLATEDKRELRAVFIKEQSIQTGREVRSIAMQTVTDPVTGETEPAYPEGHPKQVRKGVEAFTNHEDELVLRFKRKGSVPLDYKVANWSDASIGLITEALGFAVGLEEVGLGIFTKAILDQTALGLEAPMDAEDLHQLRRVLSSLIGGFEAHDGDIFDVNTRRGLLTYQADLLDLKDLEPEQQNMRMRSLGLLRQGGQLNFDAVHKFGILSRNTFGLKKPNDGFVKSYLTT